MKAIMQTRYGSPDVLRLEEVDTPVPKDDEVLVRVRAAAVNIGDWHLLRGIPYVIRLGLGLRRPRRETPGLDIAGEVEAVGSAVTDFRPGDEVFGWGTGAFAEYVCTSERNLLPKPAEPDVRAVGGRRRLRVHRPRRRSRSRAGAARAAGADQRRIGRRRHVRRADRQGIRSARDRRLQHEERRHGPVAWRGPGHRLREAGLRDGRATGTT